MISVLEALHRLKRDKSNFGPFWVMEYNGSRVGEKLAHALGYAWVNQVGNNAEQNGHQKLQVRSVVSISPQTTLPQNCYFVEEFLSCGAKDEYECVNKLLSELVDLFCY